MRANNRFTSVIGNLREIKEANLLFKVTNTFQKTINEDTDMIRQRCLQILTIEPEKRSIMQAKYVQKYFERDFAYFSKIRGQLPDDLYIRIFKDLQIERINAAEVVFNMGDIGRKMYFIIDGEVAILIPMQESQHHDNPHHQRRSSVVKKFDDLLKHKYAQYKLIAIKSKNDFFGEIAIEQRIPRTASVVAKTECVFATLSYESYQKVLGQYQEKILEEKLQFIKCTPPFKNWSQSGQLVLLHSCQEMSFDAGSFIYKRGQKGDQVYIIKEGEILIEKWGKQQSVTQEGDIYLKKNIIVVGLYSTGQIFGDYEVYQTNMKCRYLTRITQAKARAKTVVLALSISQYIDNMRLNERDGWIRDYFEQKFSKKWLNKPEISTQNVSKSPIPSNNKQYIKSREDGRQAYKVSLSNNYFEDLESENKNNSKDLQLLSPTQLHSQNKSNKTMRKFLSLQGSLFKTQQNYEAPSMEIIIKQLKNKVIKSRENLTNESIFDISQSKFYSVKKLSAPKLKIGFSFKSFREGERNKSKFLD
ncbi:unnamed protein product (macronuclear) [Paramecium tetraurelia]|uniref:Cyclic nucleotide-binding domain-containing protein n=1 Tax=Paramecium tetraurelia TaxID=5888 RepID=A0E1P8_PARTE|nr:uncharacterized protein GSPATT00022386001 [Paramecium tetraurelia]CAK89215.1 unnamed protein product [Paramecium tetraurelia]|eukprot:XP_001456612.1 hypothetical protein (macronuclear) [Paramecium tetraurelia strain d4-2]